MRTHTRVRTPGLLGLVCSVVCSLVACGTTPEPLPADYHEQVQAFRDHRATEIIGPTGWAALVGLHWVEPGPHTVGAAADNDVRLTGPSAPPSLGTLVVNDTGAVLTVADGLAVTQGGTPVSVATLTPEDTEDRYVAVGGLTLTLIKRGERFALRVWDSAAPVMVALPGLEWMPIDDAWRIEATFEPHTPEPHLKILNVLDEIVDMRNPGAAVFSVGGQQYRLEALLEEDDAQELFFMFRDGTSGTRTYGAGRYLYTPLPKDGRVILDFNQAKNPPCAFTVFATCPLPPKGNILSLPVEAGELYEGHQ